MRVLFRLLLLALVTGPFVLAWLALQPAPLVPGGPALSHEDLARAQEVVQANDPRTLSDGASRRVEIAEADLTLAANHLLRPLGGAARVTSEPGRAELAATVEVPRLPLRPYVNLSLTLTEQDGEPRIGDLRIGQVPVPDPLADLLLDRLQRRLVAGDGRRLAEDLIQDLDIAPGGLALTYVWRPEMAQRVRQSLLGGADRAALTEYYNRLAVLHQGGTAHKGSLAPALQTLFAYAKGRSQGGDAARENQALLLVLGAWATGRGMDRLVPAQAQEARLEGFGLTLQGRGDFAQHFLASAALTAGGDSALSDAVGLLKEVQDADGGSGFSFTDLAADRAGTRFGELSTGSEAGAQRVQRRLAKGVEEDAIMPEVRDLPEHMGAAEFERRFGGVGSAAYEEMRREIERRIDACALYREG